MGAVPKPYIRVIGLQSSELLLVAQAGCMGAWLRGAQACGAPAVPFALGVTWCCARCSAATALLLGSIVLNPCNLFVTA